MQNGMSFEKGIILEYRMQRLFLGRGIYAERSLFPAIGQAYDKQATDIDVLATIYGTGFHASRINVESKSGKNVSKLDRILWLAGVQRLIKADSSYLVALEVEQDVAEFGKKLNILTFSEIQLDLWEKSLGLAPDSWLGRSNYHIYESAASAWAKLQQSEKGQDAEWNLLKDINRFLKYDSWVTFSYSNLNRLLRLAQMLAAKLSAGESTGHKKLCSKYYLAALLVRLNQLLVGVCEDVLTIPKTSLESYLTEKLTYGESGASSGAIVEKTLDWVAKSLKSQGLDLPDAVKSARVTNSPSYTAEFVNLVQQLLVNASETSYLPLASELSLFGEPAKEDWPETLKVVFGKGQVTSAFTKGFFLRLTGLHGNALDGLAIELGKEYAPVISVKVKTKPNDAVERKQVVAQLASMPHEAELGEEGIEQQEQAEKSVRSRLEISSLADETKYLRLYGSDRKLAAEALYSDSKYRKFLAENGLSEGDRIVLDEERFGIVKGTLNEPFSDKTKLGISADWVEKFLKLEAKEVGFQIKGSPDWNYKIASDSHDFTIKVDGTNRTFTISTSNLLEIATSQKARDNFAKKMENELFFRNRKPKSGQVNQ